MSSQGMESDWRTLLTPSAGLADWLLENNISLAFTTHPNDELVLVGVDEAGELSVVRRYFPGASSVWSDGRTLLLSTGWSIWHFINALQPGQRVDGHDRLFVPRRQFVTGELGTVDPALDHRQRIVFGSKELNCLGTVSPQASICPLWRTSKSTGVPSRGFLSTITGMADSGGILKYVTLDSWQRSGKPRPPELLSKGILLDLENDHCISTGLSGPVEPRFDGNHVWVAATETGYLSRVKPSTGQVEDLIFCPGVPTALRIVREHAVAGISHPDATSPLSQMAHPKCGVHMIELKSGTTQQWINALPPVTAIGGLAILEGCRQPTALGTRTEEIQRLISIET